MSQLFSSTSSSSSSACPSSSQLLLHLTGQPEHLKLLKLLLGELLHQLRHGLLGELLHTLGIARPLRRLEQGLNEI